MTVTVAEHLGQYDIQVGICRTTLTAPYLPWYKQAEHSQPTSEQGTGPFPYRLIAEKLGLTDAEFEDKITTDIDELLSEIEEERRQALLECLPFERVLTKADCHRIFSAPDAPQTGSTLGILRWASEPD